MTVRDDTAALQAAFNASYGRTVFLPKGTYVISAPLTIQPIFGGTSSLPFHLLGAGFDGNGGNGGTTLKVVGAGHALVLDNSSAGNSDNRITIEGLVIAGDGADAAGGDGLHVVKCNALIVRDVFVNRMRGNGMYCHNCYGSAVEDVTFNANRLNGFWADGQFNLGELHRVKSYSNGCIWSASPHANIMLTGGGGASLGTRLVNVDASYAGSAAYSLFSRSTGTLTSISVSAGLATVTTATAHQLTSGVKASVVGATVAPALNTFYEVPITVTGGTTFTFTTAAPDGLYAEASLTVGPAAYGFFLTAANGLELNGYVEDSVGPALYLGADVSAFSISGGYWQGSQYGATVIIDDASNGEVGSMLFNGPFARLFVATSTRKHNVNVKSDLVFRDGASLVKGGPLWLQDGVYSSKAPPPLGSWAAGDVLKNAAPAVGQPKGWVCTQSGTPGTWVSEGTL